MKLLRKVWNFLLVLAPLFAMFEGVEHIVMSSVSFWGIFANHIHDWRVWSNPAFDFCAGGFNILFGIYMKIKSRKQEKPSE